MSETYVKGIILPAVALYKINIHICFRLGITPAFVPMSYQFDTRSILYIMLVISSRGFRDKQAEYVDRVDKGEQIIVQRGRDKAYAITPVNSSDIYVNTQILSEDFITGQQVRERLHRHIDKLFSEK